MGTLYFEATDWQVLCHRLRVVPRCFHVGSICRHFEDITQNRQVQGFMMGLYVVILGVSNCIELDASTYLK
jgi:hypothetical protein